MRRQDARWDRFGPTRIRSSADAGCGVRDDGTRICVFVASGLGSVAHVKTLHTAFRVADLAASLDFYLALGYDDVGRVDVGGGAT